MEKEIKTTFTSEKSERIKNCFLKKILEFEKNNNKFLSYHNLQLDNLFTIFSTENYIQYNFRDSFKKLDLEFQNEAELFFKEAFNGCLDKYS